MKYVALLRGINVGGKARVEMKRLRRVFELLGCESVSTYINSGNVIFTDTRSTGELESLLKESIEQEFGFSVPVIVREAASIQRICQEIPSEWTNDSKQKTDVMFLWSEIASEDILKNISINSDIEQVHYVEKALIWNIPRQFVTRGGGIKLIKTDYYKKMTVRNINTVRKLGLLLEQ